METTRNPTKIVQPPKNPIEQKEYSLKYLLGGI